MKKSLIGAVIATAAIGATFAVQAQTEAQTAAQSQARNQAEQSVQIPAPARGSYAMGANEFADFANSYALSNGQVATFTQRGNHYFVQLNTSLRAQQRADGIGKRGTTTRLRPIGPDTFVTDGGALMTFREYGDKVTINNFERLPEARVAANALNVRMIASR